MVRATAFAPIARFFPHGKAIASIVVCVAARIVSENLRCCLCHLCSCCIVLNVTAIPLFSVVVGYR